MRQLFTAVVCSIPDSLVVTHASSDSNILLSGGGRLNYNSNRFPSGRSWYMGEHENKFDAPEMARWLFGNCAPRDICIVRPTLHRVFVEEEVRAISSKEFHEALRGLQSHNLGWTTALGPSTQHFRSNAATGSPSASCSGIYSSGADESDSSVFAE